jgi:cytochrome c peroxidase
VFQLGILPFLSCCGSASHQNRASHVSEKPIGAAITIKPPLGLPPVPVPNGNPETEEAIALGRRLFYEKRLSSDESVACSTCHNPLLAFTDGQKQSRGVGGKIGTRNAPSVINAAYSPLQFWDGRAPSLEEQAAGPIANPLEMNQRHEICVSKLEADPEYKSQFQKTFGPGPVTLGKVENALASFERTLLSGNSQFDRYQFGGEKSALSPSAIRGLAIFRDVNKGNCATCHAIGGKDALFTDGKFHNIGVSVNAEGELTDLGRYDVTKIDTDKGAFMTPTLRNVAKSAPYMHDGSLKTLKAVVDFYAGGGNSNLYLDREIKEIKLTGQERSDLVEFLESLTGEVPPDSGPPQSEPAGQTK